MKNQADILIEKAEEQRRLKKMGKKATGLAQLLSGKDEIELLTDIVKQDLPVLYLNLNQRYAFFKMKGPADPHLPILKKELNITEKYLDVLENVVSLQQLKEINEYISITTEFYSFDV